MPLTLQVALGVREKLLIYGGDWETPDGTCVRDFVHTEDLAQAHQRAIETLEPGTTRVYNLGSGTGNSVLEVLRACEDVVGRPIRHEIVERRPGDPAVLIATPEKITRNSAGLRNTSISAPWPRPPGAGTTPTRGVTPRGREVDGDRGARKRRLVGNSRSAGA